MGRDGVARWRPDWPEATSGGRNAAARATPKLLRCPAGAWPVWRGNRGPRPLARACPRLISCGVPPGPKARRPRQFSGGLMIGSATAKSSRAARIFPGARLCARRTSRSGLAPGDASDSNGHLRGFWAAAAGPRRTRPRSLGCGSAALCSSCLCGPSELARLNSYGLATSAMRGRRLGLAAWLRRVILNGLVGTPEVNAEPARLEGPPQEPIPHAVRRLRNQHLADSCPQNSRDRLHK